MCSQVIRGFGNTDKVALGDGVHARRRAALKVVVRGQDEGKRRQNRIRAIIIGCETSRKLTMESVVEPAGSWAREQGARNKSPFSNEAR